MSYDLGAYPTQVQNPLLATVKLYSFGILFLGLIFDVVLVLFVIVSILLIYSLLMITVEEKTFDSGVMRLLGMTKAGYVGSILLQAFMFVAPSIITGYLLSYPCLYYILNWMFKG